MGLWDKAKELALKKAAEVMQSATDAVQAKTEKLSKQTSAIPAQTEKLEDSNQEVIDRLPGKPKVKTTKRNGMSVGQIILLRWSVGKKYDAEFPGYFSYDYGINPIAERALLFQQGFLTLAGPEQSLNNVKVVDLKQILVSATQTPKGRKADLIKQIIENVPPEPCSDQLVKIVAPTEKGLQVISDTELIYWAHAKVKANIDAVRFMPYLPTKDNDIKTFANIAAELGLQDLYSNMRHGWYGSAGSSAGIVSKMLKAAGDASWFDYFVLDVWFDYVDIDSLEIQDIIVHQAPGQYNVGYIQGRVQASAMNGAPINATNVRHGAQFIENRIIPLISNRFKGSTRDMEAIFQSLITDSPEDAEKKRNNFRKRL